jgi:hypothetical protein
VVPRRSLAFVLLLALTGGAPAADLSEIKAAGGWRVLVSADEVPEMFSFADGPAPGFEREILEGFAPNPAERRGAWGARRSAPQNE